MPTERETLAKTILEAVKDEALVERLAAASGIMSGSRDVDPDDVANILTAFAAELTPRGDHGAR